MPHATAPYPPSYHDDGNLTITDITKCVALNATEASILRGHCQITVKALSDNDGLIRITQRKSVAVGDNIIATGKGYKLRRGDSQVIEVLNGGQSLKIQGDTVDDELTWMAQGWNT